MLERFFVTLRYHVSSNKNDWGRLICSSQATSASGGSGHTGRPPGNVRSGDMTFAEFIVELAESFKAGRRRYLLASITTMFGVFLLTLLTGAGYSITRGINVTYGYAEKNLLRISPGLTSLPCGVYDKGRTVTLNDNDVRCLENAFPEQIREVIPVTAKKFRVNIDGRSFPSVAYGVRPGYMDAMFLVLCGGRDISRHDIDTESRTCLISKSAAECYFDAVHPEKAISGYVNIGGARFQIVGIFKALRKSHNTDFVIVPGSTASSVWGMADNYKTVILNLNGLHTESENAEFKDRIRGLIAREHSFDSRDESALSISDNFDAYRQMKSILGGLRASIILFCILILVSEIFGVSNILFISVRERTYEIVLRRLMGASDANIFALVVCEAVLIMTFSALAGMLLADGVLYAANVVVAPTRAEDYYIWGDFNMDFPVVVIIFLATVASGIIAGFAPARKAVELKITQIR